MKLQQKAALVGLLVFWSSLFMSVAHVQAKASQTPISFSFSLVYIPGGHPDEKKWISEGILHARKADHNGMAWGDLEGSTRYLGNLNAEIDAAGHYVNGNGWGTFTIGTASDWFEGILVLKIRNYLSISGQLNCHGNGMYEGMHLKATFVLNLGTGSWEAEGTILDAHDG
ncbi:MAG: hypothetical protein ACFFFG_14295 [Candidatus Thorarchaeota archaeon]